MPISIPMILRYLFKTTPYAILFLLSWVFVANIALPASQKDSMRSICGWACWLVCKYWFLEIQLPRPLQSLTVMATERLILVNWHWKKENMFMYRKRTPDLCMRTRKDFETLENGKCFTKAAFVLHSQMFMFWLIYRRAG